VDDGYRDFYEHAWPVLREYKVPCTVFVTVGFIAGEQWLWADELEYLVFNGASGHYQLTVLGKVIRFELGNAQSRREAWRSLAAPLVKNNEARYAVIRDLERLLGLTVPKSPTEEYAAMNWEQLFEVSQGGIDIGGHSWTHAFLPGLDDSALEHELIHAKHELERQLGKPVTTFAYPNGSLMDSPSELVDSVSKAGYHGAAVAYKPRRTNEDVFRLGRWPGGTDTTYFKNVAHGALQLKRKIDWMMGRDLD